MKQYIVEYMKNGNTYDKETFTDYIEALRFYNRIRRREWARLS